MLLMELVVVDVVVELTGTRLRLVFLRLDELALRPAFELFDRFLVYKSVHKKANSFNSRFGVQHKNKNKHKTMTPIQSKNKDSKRF